MQRYISKINTLVGHLEQIENRKPRVPFDELVCDFLDHLSKKLLKDKEAKAYSDVVSFAFWCHKANINRLKKQRAEECRIGRGTILHITPSNVPVNFAFSLVFGLLAGNANVIRISSKPFPQVGIICRCINEILIKEFEPLSDLITIVSYERNHEITDYLSARCDGRVIWGGDATIEEIRQSKMPVRAVEIVFADRFSIGIIEIGKMAYIEDWELQEFTHSFYNDTYFMDQNACSAPHLLFWKISNPIDESEINSIKERVYQAIVREAKKYDLQESKVSDKYTGICKNILKLDDVPRIRTFENLLYLIELKALPDNITDLRGNFGTFFTYDIKELEEIIPIISNRVQTCLYFGMEKQEIADLILGYGLKGIDRIVPFGSSLDVDIIWDGYDIIGNLSRIVG